MYIWNNFFYLKKINKIKYQFLIVFEIFVLKFSKKKISDEVIFFILSCDIIRYNKIERYFFVLYLDDYF